MKVTILVITAFVVAGLVIGCKSQEEQVAPGLKPSETAAMQLDKAKTETKEAVQATQDYAYAQRADFIAKMNAELAQLQNEMNRLSAKVENSKGEAKADAKAKVEAVREKWTLAKKQLDDAGSATESSWEDMKAGFKKAHQDLKDSVDTTRQWLSDKIEP